MALRLGDSTGEPLLLLSHVYYASGDLRAALETVQRAQYQLPSRADLWSHYGVIQLKLGNLDGAQVALDRALALDPTQPDAWMNLAIVKRNKGAVHDAVDLLRKATSLDPDSGRGWSNFGLALRDAERLDESLEALRRAVALRPDHAPTHLNLASVIADSGETEEAERVLIRALALDPGMIEARVARAWLLHNRGDSENAFVALGSVIRDHPGSSLARAAYGEIALWSRRFEEGWEQYEARFGTDSAHAQPQTALESWNGETLGEGELLISSEQGIGDMILFASCFSDALSRAPGAIVEAPAKLFDLFTRSFPKSTVFLQRNDRPNASLTGLDARLKRTIPAGSLMRLFRSSESDFFGRGTYLRADAKRVEYWRERLAALGGGPKIGISWQGGFIRTGRLGRSIPIADWVPILSGA
ncbi:MAG: tetratricopeptide repeat protein, partial [Burkholderiales bacterium]